MYWFGTIVYIVVHTFFVVTGWGQKSQKKVGIESASAAIPNEAREKIN